MADEVLYPVSIHRKPYIAVQVVGAAADNGQRQAMQRKWIGINKEKLILRKVIY